MLTPFRLDGLALGGFLAVAARQPKGLERLMSALPKVVAVASVLLAASFIWTRMVSRNELALAGSIRSALFLALLACMLLSALVASQRSIISRFFSCRVMVFLGTYSYGLYVYHHFFSYYFVVHRTEFVLAQWLGSHGAAVALQAALGASASLLLAYVSYELFEKRFLALKQRFRSTEDARAPSSDRHVAVLQPGPVNGAACDAHSASPTPPAAGNIGR